MYFVVLQDPAGVLEIVECVEQDDPVLLARSRGQVLLGVKSNLADAQQMIENVRGNPNPGAARGSAG